MRHSRGLTTLLVAAFVPAVILTSACRADQHEGKLDTAKIEQLTGAKGSLDEKEGVFKVTQPRDDLRVNINGVKMTPPLGLTSWAAFKNVGGSTMVMGDLTLLSDQVNPVMDVALAYGLEVTALHNHFFWDEPKVWFMHIGGNGDADKLASAVGKIFAQINQTSGVKLRVPGAEIDPADTNLNTAQLEKILGQKGELNKGVFKVIVPKTTRMHGHEMGAEMGVNTWAAFAGTGEQAVVDGDFAMYGDEVQGVLKALRKHGIYIVALHNHMIGDSPNVYFLHYWGIGPAEQLAKGLRAALDAQSEAGAGAKKEAHPR